MNPPALSIVVLTWNEIELTRRCLASVRSHTDVPYELIVVDNGSEPAAAVETEALADVAILNPSNRGFAAGMNQGLAAATAPLVAFLNNDTELPRTWASKLVATLDAHPNAGIVLPVVTAAGNQISVRSQPGNDVTTLPPFRHLPSAVIYLMKRDIIQRLGGWGEEFLVASREDLDLLFKVWCSGLDVVLDERVLVDHVSNATARSQLSDRDAIWARNREVFVDKWLAPSPDRIPRLPSCSVTQFTERLEQAATAAFWMKQRFDAEDALAASRSQMRSELASARADAREARHDLARLERSVGQPGWVSRSLGGIWNRMRRFVPASMRQRLFRRFRSSYYRSYPDKLYADRDEISGGSDSDPTVQ
jgi:GT2 family glycosyltransferase